MSVSGHHPHDRKVHPRPRARPTSLLSPLSPTLTTQDLISIGLAYSLGDTVVICIMAVIAGAESPNAGPTQTLGQAGDCPLDQSFQAVIFGREVASMSQCVAFLDCVFVWEWVPEDEPWPSYTV